MEKASDIEKASESSSDSDSNSTSWVFVYDSSAPRETSLNTFHLDCSREPIQELTEQDLMSASSDIEFESDTDGVSVISESEIPNEDPCSSNQTFSINSGVEEAENDPPSSSDDSPKTETKNVCETKETERVSKIDFRKFIKPCNILGVGFVVTAIFLASYNQILTKLNIKNSSDLQKNDAVISYDKIDFRVNDESDTFFETKRRLDEEVEEIVDMTISCTYGEKIKNEIRDREIKRCVKNQYKSKRMACLKKNAGLTDEEARRWSDVRCQIPNVDVKLEKNIVDENNNYKNKYNKKNKGKAFYDYENSHFNKKKNKAEKYERNEDINEHKSKHKKRSHSQEKFKDGTNQDSQNEKLKYKRQMPIKKPYKNEKDSKEFQHYKKKKHDYVYEDKKQKSKYKSYNKNFNKHQINDKIYVNLNNKDQRSYTDKRNNNNTTESNPRDSDKANSKRVFMMQERKEKNGTSGEWYTNLHKARTQMRKQEHLSDWVFDRAYLRGKKRNKAQWYFKWMNIREQLRYKQSYRPYSS